jgi:hypothetical protein
MEIIFTILFLATLVLSVVSLVAFLAKRSGGANRHRALMAGLTPARSLSFDEKEKFNRWYRQKLGYEDPVSVYRHEGPVEYLSLTVNHAETKEFSIGGLKIAGPSIHRLEKTVPGLNFTQLAVDASERSRERTKAILERNRDPETMDTDSMAEEIENALAEFVHQFEIVFQKNNTRLSGFLVRFDDWSLVDWREEGKRTPG